MSQELSFLSVVHFLAIFASLFGGCNGKATRGADYDQRITASPPGFENLAASLFMMTKVNLGFQERVNNISFDSIMKNQLLEPNFQM